MTKIKKEFRRQSMESVRAEKHMINYKKQQVMKALESGKLTMPELAVRGLYLSQAARNGIQELIDENKITKIVDCIADSAICITTFEKK